MLCCGVAATVSFVLPFYRVELSAGGPFHICGPDLVRTVFLRRGVCGFAPGPGARELFQTLVSSTAGARLAQWIAIGLYLVAGPALMAYFGIRLVVAALAGAKYHALGAVIVVIGYAAVGWTGIRMIGGAPGAPFGFFEMAQTGFWLGSISLILGGLAQEVTRD